MTDIPRHIAFVMDGNGRWAEAQGLPRIEGHRRGASTVRIVTETCAQAGVQVVTLYCLSSENWKRPTAELDFLMALLEEYLVAQRDEIMQQGLRLEVIGRRDRLPTRVIEEMDRTVAISAVNQGMRLVLAIDYGSRSEISQAAAKIARRVVAGELDPDAIDERTVSECLYTAHLPDPDLLVRTGGEMRISNFLLWQISYAELWVTNKCWPEFTADDLRLALADFTGRQRRFGGLAIE